MISDPSSHLLMTTSSSSPATTVCCSFVPCNTKFRCTLCVPVNNRFRHADQHHLFLRALELFHRAVKFFQATVMPLRKCLICDKRADLVPCSAACTHAAMSCSDCNTRHVEARFSAYGLQPIPCIAQSCKATLSETEVASSMSAVVRAPSSRSVFL